MADLPERVEPVDESELWSRRQFLAGTGAVFVAGAAALFGAPAIESAARSVFGSPIVTGPITIYAFDFYYVPNYMTWKVGQQMDVLWVNNSHTRWHEWTIGRKPNVEHYLLGNLTSDGWSDDFWTGVSVTLSDVYQMDNFVPNQANVSYVGPKAAYNIGAGGSFSPTLQPGGHVKLSFTVPDKPGIWHYGCFVQQQEHYRLGMRGTINILPA